jgi:hypothetical protein
MVAATMPETVALIMAFILERPMCVSCLAVKTGTASPVILETSLDRIRQVLPIRREQGRCRACGLTTSVISVERPE